MCIFLIHQPERKHLLSTIFSHTQGTEHNLLLYSNLPHFLGYAVQEEEGKTSVTGLVW
jgi:hypothetical protein